MIKNKQKHTIYKNKNSLYYYYELWLETNDNHIQIVPLTLRGNNLGGQLKCWDFHFARDYSIFQQIKNMIHWLKSSDSIFMRHLIQHMQHKISHIICLDTQKLSDNFEKWQMSRMTFEYFGFILHEIVKCSQN